MAQAIAKRMSLKTLFRPITYVLSRILNFFIDVVDIVMHPLQNRLGVQRMAWIFVAPNLIIFALFILLPMVLNFYYAFTGGSNLFPQDRPFVGADNLQRLFACEDYGRPVTCSQDLFWRAAFNTAGFVVVQVGLMVLLSLVTALALNGRIVARGFFRSVFFFPVLLSPVVVALIWKWILQQNGLLNALVVALGGDRIPFMLNSDWARFWVIIISVWSLMGFYTLILLAGLQAIPADLYEAAGIDGANQWQSFWSVTMPLLMPTMLVVLVLSLIRAVQVFDAVYAFTGGGPGTATLYMVQYIYQTAFANQTREFGLASAASVVLATVLVAFTFFQFRMGRASSLA